MELRGEGRTPPSNRTPVEKRSSQEKEERKETERQQVLARKKHAGSPTIGPEAAPLRRTGESEKNADRPECSGGVKKTGGYGPREKRQPATGTKDNKKARGKVKPKNCSKLRGEDRRRWLMQWRGSSKGQTRIGGGRGKNRENEWRERKQEGTDISGEKKKKRNT